MKNERKIYLYDAEYAAMKSTPLFYREISERENNGSTLI